MVICLVPNNTSYGIKIDTTIGNTSCSDIIMTTFIGLKIMIINLSHVDCEWSPCCWYLPSQKYD